MFAWLLPLMSLCCGLRWRWRPGAWRSPGHLQGQECARGSVCVSGSVDPEFPFL